MTPGSQKMRVRIKFRMKLPPNPFLRPTARGGKKNARITSNSLLVACAGAAIAQNC